jgi:gamma-tubulin complex component 5
VCFLATSHLFAALDIAVDVDGLIGAFDVFERELSGGFLLEQGLLPIRECLLDVFVLYEDFALAWTCVVRDVGLMKPSSKELCVRLSRHRRNRSGDQHEAEFSEDEDDDDDGSVEQQQQQQHGHTSEKSVSEQLAEFKRHLAFLLAALRGVGRVQGQDSCIILSERLLVGGFY